MATNKAKVVLDFNGVFDNYTGWLGKGDENTPRPGIENFLESLSKKFYIDVCTAIDPALVERWLIKYDLMKYINAVTNIKPPALLYVDDRAICFRGDYDQTLEEILKFKAYWEKGPDAIV